MATNLDILIRAQDDASNTLNKVERNLGDLDKTAGNTNKRLGGLKSVLGTGLKIAGGAAALGIGALGFAMRDSVSLAREQINVEKQLDAVLKSTGGAAGLTAEEIKNMASELQGVTNFGDEATLAGQNMLLTFTNIGKDVFPAATETMLNLSQAMGQDIKTSAVQLGKALNDPIAGISSLSRVGVQFTDQQKDQVKAMVEANDIAGAQALILGELEQQFGGSARAMADPVVQLQNSWGDFKEEVGKAIIPLLNQLATHVLPILMKAITVVTESVAKFTSYMADGYGPVESIMKVLEDFLPPETIDRVWGFIDAGKTFIERMKALGKATVKAFDSVKRVISAVLNFLSPIFEGFGKTIKEDGVDRFAFFKDWIDENLPRIQEIVQNVVSAMTEFWSEHGEMILGVVKNTFTVIFTVIDTIIKNILDMVQFWLQIFSGDWEGAFDTLKGIVERTFDAIKLIFQTQIDSIKSIFSDFDWGAIGAAMMDGIANGIRNGASRIADAARGAAQSAFDSAKSFLGIHSPSSVTEQKIGVPFAQGIAVGIDKELSNIQRGINMGMGSLVGGASMQPAMAGSSYNIIVNMSGGTYSDGRAVGRGISDEMRARGLG